MRVYLATVLIFAGVIGGLAFGSLALIVGVFTWSPTLIGVGLACFAVEELSCVVVQWLYPTMRTPPTFIQHLTKAKR
jgi:hypothetical protein